MADYHPVIDGPVRVTVSAAEHPKVAKGGNHAVDIKTSPGQAIYAPADGKIPHALPDSLDGGKTNSKFFTIDLTKANKADLAIRVVFAHVVREDAGRAVVKRGDKIGTASGDFLHVGCNNADALNQIIGA